MHDRPSHTTNHHSGNGKMVLAVALKIELQPLRSYLSENLLPDEFTRLHFLETGVGKKKVMNSLSGLGKTAPAAILNVGTAGALSPELKRGDLFFPEEVMLFENKQIISITGLQQNFSAGKTGLLVTSARPVISATHKETMFRETTAAAVDMECFHLADWCRETGIPFQTIKVISDLAESLTFAKFIHLTAEVLPNLYLPVFETIVKYLGTI